MQLVKLIRSPIRPGQHQFRLTIPLELATEIPAEVTHMTVERFDGGILFRPLEPRK